MIVAHFINVFAVVHFPANIYQAEAGTLSFAEYGAVPSMITIKPGEFTSVVTKRALTEIAGRFGDREFKEGVFHRFLWHGKSLRWISIPQKICGLSSMMANILRGGEIIVSVVEKEFVSYSLRPLGSVADAILP